MSALCTAKLNGVRDYKSYNLGLKEAKSQDVLAMHLNLVSIFAIICCFSCQDKLRSTISLIVLRLVVFCPFGTMNGGLPRVTLLYLLLLELPLKQRVRSRQLDRVLRKIVASPRSFVIISNLCSLCSVVV